MVGTARPQDRRVVIRVAIILALTAVLITTFFSYMHFEIYGEGEFCRQKYDLPAFSYYSERLDCFVFLGDLAAKASSIFIVVGGPLLLSGILIIWLGWRQRGARLGGPQSVPPVPAQDDPVDVACQVQLFLWILTVSLAIPVGVCFALWVVGLGSETFGAAIGAVLFYGLHLYPAGVLAFAAVQAVSWAWRTVLMAVRLSR